MIKHELPALADLHAAPEEAFKNDKLNLLLNQPPSDKWVKKHPMAKKKDSRGQSVPAEYLPIDKVEFLLTRIFQKWRVEVLSTSVMFQSIAVTIRLHYLHPISLEWSFHDGVGAKSVQTDSGYSAADLDKIKDAAVMMALPSAKSYAIKDAAQHLGILFGRDLNRKDTMEFVGGYNVEVPPPPPPAAATATTQTQDSSPSNDFVL